MIPVRNHFRRKATGLFKIAGLPALTRQLCFFHGGTIQNIYSDNVTRQYIKGCLFILRGIIEVESPSDQQDLIAAETNTAVSSPYIFPYRNGGERGCLTHDAV